MAYSRRGLELYRPVEQFICGMHHLYDMKLYGGRLSNRCIGNDVSVGEVVYESVGVVIIYPERSPAPHGDTVNCHRAAS